MAFSGDPSNVQFGIGSPIGGVGLPVVVGGAVVEGSASCQRWEVIRKPTKLYNVVLFFIKHLTGGFIEQNSSCSEVSKWKSSRAT